ncbi:hypothetical protein FS837_012775 [Tulasnella sp. UAMH 9824]|nr:hypothetical protein FS837_012775 [Tulasnella sp. UAMH 9824]
MRCVGCGNAILKQFVEISRNSKEEYWHPECSMIYKARRYYIYSRSVQASSYCHQQLWNVKLASGATGGLHSLESKSYAQEEAKFNAVTLKEEQTQMETLACRIWTSLSAFEESGTACISDMLSHVSDGMYLDAIRMAEKFILHVEVLFAVTDELHARFVKAGAKGMSHFREARMLCCNTVDLFTHSSSSPNPSQVQSQRMSTTQDLPALVTGLAHYLKILIKIALAGALKLEREYSSGDELLRFMNRLQYFQRDGANSNAKRQQHATIPELSEQTNVDYSDPKAIAQAIQEGASPILTPPSDLCVACKLTVEEDCVRLGTCQRWHLHCVECVTCGNVAAVAPPKGEDETAVTAEANANGSSSENKRPSKVTSARRPPATVDDFRYEQLAVEPSTLSNKIPQPEVVIYCATHATSNCRSRFSAVSCLEQYAFLLKVALRKLFLILHNRGIMHFTGTFTPSSTKSDSPTNFYRDSAEILRKKTSVHLGPKLSTTAPHRPQVSDSPPAALSPKSIQPSNYRSGLQEDGVITLADLPSLLGLKHARQPLLAEMTPLELVIIKNFAILAFQRSPLKDQIEVDDLLELIEVKKSVFWYRPFKTADKKDVKKKGTSSVFGVPLELLAEQGTGSMLGPSCVRLRVPIFIDDVISAMKQMDMSIEGIFRKNGNIRRLKELTDALDRDANTVDLTQENPVQLAALMKKFFRDLPDPLMTFKLHKLWSAVASLPLEEELLCIILPKPHRDTMEAFFAFLKWVASFSHVDEETGSKVDLQNLATVICPSILYAKGREASREDSFTAIPVVMEFLEDQDEFYTVPDEFIPILKDQEYFANCLDMQRKDVLKKADTYLRTNSSSRSFMPGQNSGYIHASSSVSGLGGNGHGDGAESRLV